jgi:hypothetical protein
LVGLLLLALNCGLSLGGKFCLDEANAGQGYKILRPWTFTTYGGRWVDEDLDEILVLETSFPTDSYILAAALAKEFYRGERFCFEWEVQVVQHFNSMDHMEFNALVTARWPFFHNSPVWDMSLATGAGLSLATETPVLEAAEKDVEDPSAFLAYLMIEYTVAMGHDSPWDMMFRIHHRSGVGGLLGDNGSNFLCLGVKFHF